MLARIPTQVGLESKRFRTRGLRMRVTGSFQELQALMLLAPVALDYQGLGFRVFGFYNVCPFTYRVLKGLCRQIARDFYAK